MFYNDTTPQPIAVLDSDGFLPAQGRIITSTGQSGDSSRRVQVVTLFPDVPSIFDAAVFSPPGLIK